MPLKDYETLGKIGEGTYGVVFKATKGANNEEFAIKRFKRFRDEGGISPSAIREIKLLRELKHPRIVEMTEVLFDEKRRLHLIYRYAEHDLGEMIKWHRDERSPMDHGIAKSIMWQTLDAVNFMHENGMIHRDLKPANILVTHGDASPEPGQVKLADLGLARVFDQPLRSFTACDPVVVTMWYRPPELLLGSRHHTCAIDAWALGCIFAEMAKSRALFQGKEVEMEKGKPMPPGGPYQKDQVERIFNILGKPTRASWSNHHQFPEWKNCTEFPPKPSCLDAYFGERGSWLHHPNKAFRLLEGLLQMDPNRRLTVGKAMKEPYFNDKPEHRPGNVFEGIEDPYPLRPPEPHDSDVEGEPKQKKRKTDPKEEKDAK